MQTETREKLEATGWTVGTTGDFLDLTPGEAELVEIKLALARHADNRQLTTDNPSR
ncbi:MAG TPA: hypothetical protein VGQ76_15135 [Thermoanaerobaculia bacterium]|jgi:hypothetical protein|nr:hypothetical protein [Thermoanaerobaculia bacterium]